MAISSIVAAIGGSVLSSAIGAKSAGDATDAQVGAANRQTALEGRIYDETTARFDPFVQSGSNALAALNYELGLGERPTFGGNPLEVNAFTEEVTPATPATQMGIWQSYGRGDSQFNDGSTPAVNRTGYRVGDQVFYDEQAANDYAAANPTGGTEYGGFEATPWQKYTLKQGQRAIDSSASARGGLYSGATLRALNDYGQTTGNSFYENYLNRLTGQAASGQNAAGNMATAGANYATGAGNAMAAAGNAQAAGAIGVGNAINSGINNAFGLWNYQSQQAQTPQYTASSGVTVPQNLFRQVQGAV